MNILRIKSFIINIFLPLFLVFFWFTASLLLNNKYSFTALIYPFSGSQLIQYPANKLLKGEKIKGEFKAKDNNLGMITVRFKDYVKHEYNEEDIINFRIKEKDSPDWYYIGDYRSGSIENQMRFPFGFPVIKDSKDKIYVFEITSLYGNENNAVELNISDPQLTAVHKFTKNSILFSSKSAFLFIVKKIIISFSSIDFLLSSTLYLIPLVIYVAIKGLYCRPSKITVHVPTVVLLFIAVDIVLIQDMYIGVVVILIIGWMVSIKQNYLDSKSSYLFAFILLTIWLPLMYFNTKYIQNKLNIWVYFFLFAGTIQAIIEEKYPKGKRTNIIDILNKILH